MRNFKQWRIDEAAYGDIEKVAQRAGLDISKFDRSEIVSGFKVEREHDGKMGKDTDVVRSDADVLKIALAHLREDPKYYSKLGRCGIKGESAINEAAKKDSKKEPKKESKAKKDASSNRVKCMNDMVAHLKKVFSDYDMSTRKFVWEKLHTPRGKELVDKLLKNPKAYISNSGFVELVTKR